MCEPTPPADRLVGGSGMVNHSEAQFYTMEGIAAAVLMVLTAYLVLGGTTMYTPGDTHIIDMQLEQLGNDALKIMDTRNNNLDEFSQLEYIVGNMTDYTYQEYFKSNFSYLTTSSSYFSDDIQFKADIYYINSSQQIKKYPFTQSERPFSGNENAVRVTRWVFVDKGASNVPTGDGFRDANQTVLLEVLLWRG